MSPESQNVLPFDPNQGTLPEPLRPGSDGVGEVVVLLADPATRESGWAPRTAVALARRWAEAGQRIFLMDGDLAEPELHGLLNEDNGEGVSDAVLYGVSPSRMARMQEEGFLFAPAGTAIADPSSVLRHPRWTSVLAACRESESVVVLYLPAGSAGADHLAGEADRVIRLKTALSAAAAATEEGTWIVHPPRTGKAGAEAETPSRSEEEVPAGATSSAPPADPLRDRADESRGTETASPPTAGTDQSGKEASPATKDEQVGATGIKPRPVRRRTSPWLLLLLVLLVGGVLAALWLGLVQIPGLGTTPAGALSPESPLPNP